MNITVINSLTLILSTYQSIVAYFYQRIPQNKYTNNILATYAINYELLLPSSEYIFRLNQNQVNAQIQSYIDLCNALMDYINTNVNTQTILFYQQIQNQLNDSITQLNGFAVSLLDAEYQSLRVYTVPYDMSLSTALYINNINLDTYDLQTKLNAELADFNNLKTNTKLILSI
jgi:hypothetical protein